MVGFATGAGDGSPALTVGFADGFNVGIGVGRLVSFAVG